MAASGLTLFHDLFVYSFIHRLFLCDRIVIRFIPVPAEFCSFNGSLHDVSIERDEDLLNKQEG